MFAEVSHVHVVANGLSNVSHLTFIAFISDNISNVDLVAIRLKDQFERRLRALQWKFAVRLLSFEFIGRKKLTNNSRDGN